LKTTGAVKEKATWRESAQAKQHRQMGTDERALIRESTNERARITESADHRERGSQRALMRERGSERALMMSA